MVRIGRQFGTPVWCCYSARLPEDALEVLACDIPALPDLQGIYLANRAIWDFGTGAGLIVDTPATEGDIDAYLAAWDSLMTEVLH